MARIISTPVHGVRNHCAVVFEALARGGLHTLVVVLVIALFAIPDAIAWAFNGSIQGGWIAAKPIPIPAYTLVIIFIASLYLAGRTISILASMRAESRLSGFIRIS